jgi:ABC-2 type transport system ATP-binding protein
MSQAAIRIEGITKRYGTAMAVDRLSVEVPVGSVFALLGENGAGKTTTIQSILGLVPPDTGRVETLGLDPARRGLAVRRKVGYVPERPGLYDWMTVAEIGWFAAGFHPECPNGAAGFETRYRSMVAGFALPLKRKLGALSKGMRAKVSLALAMASEPELLILDEPTSGLDVLVRREFLESMVDLAGAGRTVLLSSHQISEVERVASHVALLHQGRLILSEPLDELKSRSFQAVVTFSSGAHADAPPPELPIEVIDVEDGSRQARWLVHAEDVSALGPLRAVAGVTDLQVERPSLEEIYIGYMRRRVPERPSPAVAHVA